MIKKLFTFRFLDVHQNTRKKDYLIGLQLKYKDKDNFNYYKKLYEYHFQGINPDFFNETIAIYRNSHQYQQALMFGTRTRSTGPM